MTPGEPREEPVRGLHVHERHLEVPAERLLDLLGLALAVQAVVDEHARELVADRPVHEERRHRGVDAAARARTAPRRRRPARGSRATASSMMFAGVQSGSRPHPS